jgi:DNA recombination protein RmuC
MQALMLILGAVLGGLGVALISRGRLKAVSNDAAQLRDARDEARLGQAERERQLAEVRGELQAQVARLEAELRAERDGNDEKVRLLEETRGKLDETIKASCVDAFKEGNEQVVELAAARLRAERAESRREIEQMVKPVAEGLTQFKRRLDDVEQAQVEGRTELREQLTALGQAQQQLMSGTDALVGALQRPQIRGRWGEMTLRRVVETAGMQPHVDFTEQRVPSRAVISSPGRAIRFSPAFDVRSG